MKFRNFIFNFIEYNSWNVADWWYAVIGHLDLCNQNCCHCHYNGKKVMLCYL